MCDRGVMVRGGMIVLFWVEVKMSETFGASLKNRADIAEW